MANEIYNTSWWGTALDTARTAGTNPDFFGSQFKLLTSEQDNIVVNGDFATDSDWSKGTGWSIQNGYAESDGTNAALDQTGVLTIGKQYKVVITVENMTASPLSVRLGSSSSNQVLQITSYGTYTAYGTAGNATFRLRSQGFNGRVTNVSVQLVRCDLDQIEAKKCLADWIHTTALKDLNN